MNNIEATPATAYVKVQKANRSAFKKIVGQAKWDSFEGVWAVSSDILTAEVVDQLHELNCYIIS